MMMTMMETSTKPANDEDDAEDEDDADGGKHEASLLIVMSLSSVTAATAQ